MLPKVRPLIHGKSLSAQTFQKTPFQRLQSFPEPLERLELLERLEHRTSASKDEVDAAFDHRIFAWPLIVKRSSCDPFSSPDIAFARS